MDLQRNWQTILETFGAGLKTSLHCAIATVGADGYPHVTPIGFVFLRDDFTAFYFEEHTKRMPQNLEQNPKVCLLTVNTGARFWFSALYKGRFSSPPALRLVGVAGERRLATGEEIGAYKRRVRSFRYLKGYDLIWRDLKLVRDIKLERVEPVSYPVMTDNLWK